MYRRCCSLSFSDVRNHTFHRLPQNFGTTLFESSVARVRSHGLHCLGNTINLVNGKVVPIHHLPHCCIDERRLAVKRPFRFLRRTAVLGVAVDDNDASWVRPGAAAATVEGARRVILCVILRCSKDPMKLESNRFRGPVDRGSLLFCDCCSSSTFWWTTRKGSAGTQQQQRRRRRRSFCVFHFPHQDCGGTLASVAACGVWCVVFASRSESRMMDRQALLLPNFCTGATRAHRSHSPRGSWSQLPEIFFQNDHDKIARTSAAIGTCLFRL